MKLNACFFFIAIIRVEVIKENAGTKFSEMSENSRRGLKPLVQNAKLNSCYLFIAVAKVEVKKHWDLQSQRYRRTAGRGTVPLV